MKPADFLGCIEGSKDAGVVCEGDGQPLYIRAHRFSSLNREGIEKSKVCGCFHCKSMFPLKDVADWTDGTSTALCPSCGIDSVIGDADVPRLSMGLLAEMYEYWF